VRSLSSTPLLRVPGLPYPELPPCSIFILPMPFPHYFTPLRSDLTSSSLASLLHRYHSKLPSPWNTSFPLPSWIRRSLRYPDLSSKYEHRTVSCAFSNSKARPFLITFLFDSMTWSSFILSLKVFTFTDPHVPPTKIISLIFQPPFSPSASLATLSRLLMRISCLALDRDSPCSL
jgi:hypothetical protein